MVSWAASALTSTTSTRAPSSARRRAVAPPIPTAPPVTMATRSDKRCIVEFNSISARDDGQDDARRVGRGVQHGLARRDHARTLKDVLARIQVAIEPREIELEISSRMQ